MAEVVFEVVNKAARKQDAPRSTPARPSARYFQRSPSWRWRRLILALAERGEGVPAPRVQARRIIAFRGLPWNNACLSFDQTKRPVRTVGVMQVRRPLYAASLGEWRPDRQMLAPFLDEIAPTVDRYDRRA